MNAFQELSDGMTGGLPSDEASLKTMAVHRPHSECALNILTAIAIVKLIAEFAYADIVRAATKRLRYIIRCLKLKEAAMDFHWERKATNRWILKASDINTEALSSISVREIASCWTIYVGESPMMGRYSSEQGAKLDAWEFAKSKRKALFGAYAIRLAPPTLT